ncbi:hypothetical protein GIB67_024685 [Kingdonia uniflora]|uniref:Uncharacterized protein n=1 Tax=Kingdonia uniflora TaxID=39325 RepID=A0A7J7LPI5_9MAGN|nr:hypothetical protein GIB67_024685 [Kingdonia uniflora]
MGWSHPEISLEDLMNLIKGFIDIMILASGYQSSGFEATWDPLNIKKALQWGIFFENVLTSISSSHDYQGSMEELDAALLELRANPCFPQGLRHLSSATLARARDFVLKQLVHTLPLRDMHLSALLTAAVETDLNDLGKTKIDSLSVYLENLMLKNKPLDLQSPHSFLDIKMKENSRDNHSQFIIEELSKRQIGASHVFSVEKGLDILSESVKHIKWPGSDSSIFEKKASNRDPSLEEKLVELTVWNHWRSRNLSYLLDKKTLRLVSGAKLIFSAPTAQWIQVFDHLKYSAEAQDLLEIIELFLLGCILRRWSHVVEIFMSVSYDLVPISKKYHELQNMLQGRSDLIHSKEEAVKIKENEILEYLTVLLQNKIHQLWNMPPVLVAVAIAS